MFSLLEPIWWGFKIVSSRPLSRNTQLKYKLVSQSLLVSADDLQYLVIETCVVIWYVNASFPTRCYNMLQVLLSYQQTVAVVST